MNTKKSMRICSVMAIIFGVIGLILSSMSDSNIAVEMSNIDAENKCVKELIALEVPRSEIATKDGECFIK